MTLANASRPSLARMNLELKDAALPVASSGAVHDDPEVVARLAEWENSGPDGQIAWFKRLIVVESLRLENAQRRELAVLAHLSQRASLCWSEDRALEVEAIGEKLGKAKKPAKIVARLRKMKHGCAWLIARWSALGLELERTGAWSEPRQSFVLDLLGIPRDERERPFADFVPTPADLADEQVAELSRLTGRALDQLDEDERLSAEAGIPVHTPPELAQVQRRKDASLRTLQWAYRQIALFSQNAPLPASPPSPKSAPPPSAPRPVPAELQTLSEMSNADYWKSRIAAYEAHAAQPAASSAPAEAPKGNRRARKEAIRRARQA